MDVDIDIGATEVVSTLTDLTSTTTPLQDSGDVLSELDIGKIAVSGDFDVIDEMDVLVKDDDSNSSPKKRRDDEDVVNSEDKENIVKQLKQMTRKELEDLILVKVVEAVVHHSDAGKMRTRLYELQAQKDKMFQRVGHLQKQVQEMSRALKLLVDNHNRDPNNLNPDKPRPPPIKFFRSVGLQVATEPAYRNGPTKVIHVNHDTPLNGIKGMNGQVAYTINGQQRIRGTPAQVVRVVNGQPPNKVPVQGVLKSASRPSNGNSPNKTVASPTIVDLTDDPAGVVTSGSVQYRIVNTQQSSVQMMPSQQGYHIVNSSVPGGGLKPVFLTQGLGGGQNQRGVQTFVVRNVAPKTSSPGTFTQTRPSVTRPAVLGTKVAATINTSITRAPMQLQGAIAKKSQFQLPALPASGVTQAPRGKVSQDLPGKPILSLNEQSDGIVLSWTMKLSSTMADMASYQLYACQEPLNPSLQSKPSSWKKVGDVKALPLPMACTLSQFSQGNRYFFIVRAVDTHGRTGPFCDPAPIVLQKKSS